jgi:outer membrane protein assembly factor BamD (BamD/ComL family)
MLTSSFRPLAAALLLFLSLDVHAKVEGGLDGLGKELTTIEGTYEVLTKNYTSRTGLFGEEDATEFYEDALAYFLLKEYERSAMDFFLLVRSNALSDPAMRAEAEWYLVESTFQMGAYSISESACNTIFEYGDGHPYFDDAVRRLLEILGLTGQQTKFRINLERFVFSGRVETNDQINYSIGKSLFWQGKNAQSKAALNEIQSDSDLYSRSQYFLGGILTDEGDLETALVHFSNSENVPVQGPIDRQIQQLAQLAQARVYYEDSQFLAAIEAYQKIPNNSSYYPDSLYELVWTFIKQESWEDAARVIDIFLIGYPDHDNAIKLRVVQGDLYLEARDYEKALVSYENVVNGLRPVRQSLGDLTQDDEAALSLYHSLLTDSDVELELPDYAMDVLTEEPMLNKSLEVNRELNVQKDQLTQVVDIASELESILSVRESLASFDAGRTEVRHLRERSLIVLINAMEMEISELESNTSGEGREKLKKAQDSFNAQQNHVNDLLAKSASAEDIAQSYRETVLMVQSVALEIDATVQSYLEELDLIEQYIKQNKEELPDDSLFWAETEIPPYKEKLKAIKEVSETIASDGNINTLLASIDVTKMVSDQALIDAIQKMRTIRKTQIAPVWSGARKSDTDKQTFDKVWKRTVKLNKNLSTLSDSITAAEGKERKLVEKRLEEQIADLALLQQDTQEITSSVDSIGKLAAINGFRLAHDSVTEKVLRADYGIVNVYWTRKMDLETKIKLLQSEQKEKKSLLDERFNYINSKIADK